MAAWFRWKRRLAKRLSAHVFTVKVAMDTFFAPSTPSTPNRLGLRFAPGPERACR